MMDSQVNAKVARVKSLALSNPETNRRGDGTGGGKSLIICI